MKAALNVTYWSFTLSYDWLTYLKCPSVKFQPERHPQIFIGAWVPRVPFSLHETTDILRNSATDLDNASLLQRSISDGQETDAVHRACH